jgi:hypothetical protein
VPNRIAADRDPASPQRKDRLLADAVLAKAPNVVFGPVAPPRMGSKIVCPDVSVAPRSTWDALAIDAVA